MKIISPFHDYYDTALRFAGEDGPVFVRKEAKCDKRTSGLFEKEVLQGYFERKGRKYSARCTSFAVLFCGWLHRGVRVEIQRPWNSEEPSIPDHCFYKTQALAEYLRQYGMELIAQNKRRWRWFDSDRLRPETILDDEAHHRYSQFSLENRIPILVADFSRHPEEERVRTNCMLKPYEFFRVFDAYNTYQELSMYIGGVLPAQDAMTATVSDKDRAYQHGYDKWSFRRMPTKRAAK